MDRKGEKVGSLEAATFTRVRVRDPTVGFVFVETLSGPWAFLGSGDLAVRIWEVRLTDVFDKHPSPLGTDLLTQNLSGTGKSL